jgi:hypothetical protein
VSLSSTPNMPAIFQPLPLIYGRLTYIESHTNKSRVQSTSSPASTSTCASQKCINIINDSRGLTVGSTEFACDFVLEFPLLGERSPISSTTPVEATQTTPTFASRWMVPLYLTRVMPQLPWKTFRIGKIPYLK